MLKGNEDLFEYPTDTLSGQGHGGIMQWPFDWWLRSETRLLGEKDTRAIAFDLFCISQGERPVGTLPTNDRVLAKLVGEPLASWERLMNRDVTPLTGWKLCRCEGFGIRYYHPKCLEIAREALFTHGKE